MVYNDSDEGHDLPTRAVAALGITAIFTSNEASFTAAFDAGGFELIIIDSNRFGIPPGVASRLTSWLDSGQRLIFSHWNMDFSGNAALRTALRVNLVRELRSPLPVHAAPDSPIDFFTLADRIPSPLSFAQDFDIDNGDAFTLADQGFVAARFTDPASSEGAILVTRNDRVIVMGVLPRDIFFNGTDADGDGINDGDELYRNEIRFLCSQP